MLGLFDIVLETFVDKAILTTLVGMVVFVVGIILDSESIMFGDYPQFLGHDRNG